MLIPKSVIKTSLVMMCLLGTLTGCLDKASTNTNSVQYTPEDRPIGVLAGADKQYKPGETVTLDGRLVGTVKNGETIKWEQLEGPAVTEITDWTQPVLSFAAPTTVDGILTYKFRISVLDSSGNVENDSSGNPLTAETKIDVYDPATLLVFEVEDTNFAKLEGVNLVAKGDAKYISGAMGLHTDDLVPGSDVLFTLTTGQTTASGNQIKPGYYNLYIEYAIPSDYGSKQAQVTVNGVKATGLQFNATSSWQEFVMPDKIQLNEGVNTIVVGGGWSYYRIDSIKLLPGAAPAKPLPVPETLTNANATKETQDLMKFLVANYASKTVAGQTEAINYGQGHTGLQEFDATVAITGGAAPAIEAFDYMDYSSSRVSCGAVPGSLTEDMIAAHKSKNIILSPLWHWNAPTKLIDSTCKGSGDTAWYKGFYSNASTFDLAKALADTNSADYQALLNDIDTISLELKKFQDAGIPLLWRPLHEAEGTWFWWGNAGPEAYKALWQLMYKRMTEVHGLNNLIWVYSDTGSLNSDWYPGDAYVDIVGYDGYTAGGEIDSKDVFKSQFSTLMNRFNAKKMVALTETGTIPDVAFMQQQNAWWSYFVTWNSGNGSKYGPENADANAVKATYAYANTITLKDVPGGRAKQEAGVYANFEIADTNGWAAQINWADTSGVTFSNQWKSSGALSLAIVKDLSAENAPSSVVLQTYPTGGIDVTGKKTLTLVAHSANAGAGTTAKLFVKYGNDWVWKDAGAVSATGDALLQLDVTDLGTLQGIGVQFEGFDATSTAAGFYIDDVKLDDQVLYDFENTGKWEFQVNWSPATGLALASDWANDGTFSLSGTTQLKAGDDNIILQTYPTGNLLLGNVTKLKVVAHAKDAGAGVTAELFAKDKDMNWKDSGEVNLVNGTAEISLDISQMGGELAGFGVRFQHPSNSTTESSFYIDSVSFE